MRNRPGCDGRTSTRVSEGPKRNAPQPLRMCPSGAAFGRAQCSIPPVLTPGRLFGERSARSYAAGPGFGGREPSRFLGGKQLEKPETDSIIAEQLSVWKGFTASPPKVFCLVPENPKRALGSDCSATG